MTTIYDFDEMQRQNAALRERVMELEAIVAKQKQVISNLVAVSPHPERSAAKSKDDGLTAVLDD